MQINLTAVKNKILFGRPYGWHSILEENPQRTSEVLERLKAHQPSLCLPPFLLTQKSIWEKYHPQLGIKPKQIFNWTSEESK